MKNVKVAVIGCTHAGTAFTKTVKELYPDVEVKVFERNDTVSFLSCGIALHIHGVVQDVNKLFYASADTLRQLGAQPYMRTEVSAVDIDSKTIKYKNLDTGEEGEETFDKIMITTGSWPVTPNVPGVNLEDIKLSKNFYHAKEIKEASKNSKNVVIVGAGLIGVELAEAFRENGKEVTLIDLENRMLAKYLDKDFSDEVEDLFVQKGIKLALGERVLEFRGNEKVEKVVTDKNEYPADLVILATGFRPVTELFKGQLEMLPNGAIVVDGSMRTSKKDVFAAGDCAAVYFTPAGKYEYIPLATNAVRMGTIAAINLFEDRIKYQGTQGTSGVKLFGYNIAATGVTENWAKSLNLEVDSVTITESTRPEFMPVYRPVTLKLVYDKKSHIILGAQLISEEDVTEAINTLSIVISKKMTLEELAFSDFFFQPYFNKPWNFVNTAALAGLKNYF